MDPKIKMFLIIFISLGFSMSASADHHEEAKTEKSEKSVPETETPSKTTTSTSTEVPVMPMMEDTAPGVHGPAKAIKEVVFSGDFAGSMAFFDPKTEERHSDSDVNLAQFNVKADMGLSYLNLGFGYGSTVRDLDPGAATNNSTNDRLGLLNASYHMKTSYGLGFMLGRFESPVGHETYNHRMNSQFTRSYGFNLAPYFSTGFGINYGQKMWNVGVLITNGRGSDTDYLDNNLTAAVTVDLDLVKDLHIDLNYVTGKEAVNKSDFLSGFVDDRNDDDDDDDVPFADMNYSVSTIDASVSYTINEMFDVALNYISSETKFEDARQKNESLAAYLNARYSRFRFGLRYEYFKNNNLDWSSDSDEEQSGVIYYNGPHIGLPMMGRDNTISSVTFAAGTKIAANTDVLLEYRMDKSKDKIWSEANNQGSDSLNRITAALMYNF